MRHLRLPAVLALGLACVAPVTSAANFSFTGNLSGDNEVVLFDFTLAEPETVTLRTLSYAGGTNAAGSLIPGGGFDPVLSLFNATSGVFITADDDSGAEFDALVVAALGAGSYIVALTQATAYSIGPDLAAGFFPSGVTNFAGRTSFWAVDILNVSSATVQTPPPPPSGVPDTGSVLAWLGFSLLGLAGFRSRMAAALARK